MSHDRDPDDEDTDRRRPTAADRSRPTRTRPAAAPPPDESEEAIPFDWGGEPSRPDAEGLRRAGRDPSVPVLPAELSSIIRQMARKMREEFARALTDGIGGGVEKRLAVLEKDFDPVRRVGRWAAGIAATALVAVIIFAYNRGQSEQHITDELQRLTTLVDKLERKIEQIGSRP